MKASKMTAVAAFAAGSTLLAAVPEVTEVTMSQAASRLVTITYSLANTNAVVTLDVQTNATDGSWASIGGAAIQNATGDVWKQVATGEHTITWRPDLSWPDHRIAEGGARVVVTAWALDNTPDYMVVDLSATGGEGTQKYYPAAEFLPGGLLSNDVYRTMKIVMRKVMASGVAWMMGSADKEPGHAAIETPHEVTLSNNYYIGVFPVTQTQYFQVCGSKPSAFTAVDYAMCPVESVSYNEIRGGGETASYWPAAPKDGTFLGKLRTKTGLDFDLPSEAQWEFAARAGNGSPRWGDGSYIYGSTPDENLGRLGCYRSNNDGATAVVGIYAPNSWGIYDMHGNVWEWCLDWYEPDITKHGGAVNVNPSDPALPLGTTSTTRVIRGGGWVNATRYCRPAQRGEYDPAKNDCNYLGFRVACTAGLR